MPPIDAFLVLQTLAAGEKFPCEKKMSPEAVPKSGMVAGLSRFGSYFRLARRRNRG
jgi:hypothetical protein